MKRSVLFLLSAAMLLLPLTGCGESNVSSVSPTHKLEDADLFVKQTAPLDGDFILGMDASAVPALERSGVRYYNTQGEEQDVFLTLAQHGINYIRVRVWNHPYDKNGNGYGGGNCDIENAVEIGKRATACGMKLLVNFHYSDFWADPGKQMVPFAWADLSIEEKAQALYEYTKQSLQLLKSQNILVGMVQIGNETNGSLCGENQWQNIQLLLKAGVKAVREELPQALVAVHFANPEKTGSYAHYAQQLSDYQVDYDVFASSYYPYWHGTLENLSYVLGQIHDLYGKKVMVMETSYAYTPEDSDFFGNTVSDSALVAKNYPYTVQGQTNSIRDVIDTVARTPGGMGVVYWEGTWITVGQSSWEENHEKWEAFGSGWASSYAAAYDPMDAGKYYGGCSVENQALFDPQGKPLPSLKVFNLVRYGNDVPLRADALQDAFCTFDVFSPIILPETVDAIMNDGSAQPVAVQWDVSPEELAQMAESGSGNYTVNGTAQQLPVKAHVTVQPTNRIQNGSFESGDLTGWELTQYGSAKELYVENKITDSLSGTYHMHYWSPEKNSVDFALEQTISDLEEGSYCYTISIMGGDCGTTEIFAYAKRNGELLKEVPLTVTSYGQWDTAILENLSCSTEDSLTLGIRVRCEGAGNGAWGKIDDAALMKVF